MSDKLAAWMLAERKVKKPAQQESGRPPLNDNERRALWKMRREARERGATLESNGRGGLPPSLVLGVMRRDGWKCKRCGQQADLSVHHKSEHMQDPKAKMRSQLLGRQGRIDSPANITTICATCHDAIHDKDREDFGDTQQQ